MNVIFAMFVACPLRLRDWSESGHPRLAAMGWTGSQQRGNGPGCWWKAARTV